MLLKKEIDRLKRHILSLSSVVEQGVNKAMIAVATRDPKLASEVIEGDPRIDQMEVDLEEECLKILALHQPVAKDLRYIVVVLKINNDLERIGDLAVNIAKRGLYLADNRSVETPPMLEKMLDKARSMLQNSLDAMVDFDAKQARDVLLMDDEVDQLHKEMFEYLHKVIRERPQDVEGVTHLLSVSRHLERIADLATNIAEDVIYLIEGRIVRHQHNS